MAQQVEHVRLIRTALRAQAGRAHKRQSQPRPFVLGAAEGQPGWSRHSGPGDIVRLRSPPDERGWGPGFSYGAAGEGWGVGTHRSRAPVGRIALLGFIALAVLLAALAFRPLSLQTAHAQANSSPEFPSEATDRTVDENTPPNTNIGAPITATRRRQRHADLLAGKRRRIALRHRQFDRPVAGPESLWTTRPGAPTR